LEKKLVKQDVFSDFLFCFAGDPCIKGAKMAFFIFITLFNQVSLTEHSLDLHSDFSKVFFISPEEAIAVVNSNKGQDYVFTFKLRDNKLEKEKIFEGEISNSKWHTQKFVSNREKTKFAYFGRNRRYLLIEKGRTGFQVKVNQILEKPPWAMAFAPDGDRMVFGFSSYQEKSDDYANKLQLVTLPHLTMEEECHFIGNGGFVDMKFVNGLFVVFYDGRISVWDFGKRFEVQPYVQGKKTSFNFYGPLVGDIFRFLNVQGDHFGLFNESIWGYYFSFVDLKNLKKLDWKRVRLAKHKSSEFRWVIYADKDIHWEERADLRGKSKEKKQLYILAKNDGSILNTVETQMYYESFWEASLPDRLGKDFVFIVNSKSSNNAPSRLVWIRNTNAP